MSRRDRPTCNWRTFVIDGNKYWSLSDFEDDKCVIISPYVSRYEYDRQHLPYFQVHAEIRRRVYESFYLLKCQPGTVMRHQCLKKSGLDSRGLCINPKHLTPGTHEQNRNDARDEEVIRNHMGYWKPPNYQTLPIMESKDINTLDPLQALSKDEIDAYTHCDMLAGMLLRSAMPYDIELIRRATNLLESIRANNLEQIDLELEFFKSVPRCKRSRLYRCNKHYSIINSRSKADSNFKPIL